MTPPQATTVSNLINIFKTRYRETGEEDKSLFAKHVLYGKIMRERNLTGQTIAWPIKYDDATGHARGETGLAYLVGDLTNSNIGTQKYKQWNLNLEVEYAAHFFDNIAKLKMSNDLGAYKRNVESEMASVLKNFSRSVGHALYRDGTGVIGTVSAITAFSSQVATITLTNRSDTKFFMNKQKYNVIDHTSLAAPRGGDYITSYLEVDAIDRVKGTLLVRRVGTNAVESTAVGNFLSPITWYVQGGVGRIKGLGLICPSTAPTAGDNTYGVDRSTDVQRLSGWRFDDATSNASQVSLEDQIREMVVYMSSNGAASELWAMANPVQVEKMLQRANGRLQYTEEGRGDGEFKYGYKYAVISTSSGDVKVYSDPDCPEQRWWGMSNSSIKLGTLGDEPEVGIFDGGKNTMTRQAIDGEEFRARLLAQVLPDDPSSICTGPLA
jgi:hypothetical protein